MSNKHSKPTLLCLHCSGSSGSQWRKLAAAGAHHFKCITPDLLGYGENQSLYNKRSLKLRLDDEVDALAPLLHRSEQKVYVLGHSYGGALALYLAQRFPNQIEKVWLYEPAILPMAVHTNRQHSATQEFLSLIQQVLGSISIGNARLAAEKFISFWSGAQIWNTMTEDQKQKSASLMPKIGDEFQAVFSEYDQGIWSPLSITDSDVPMTFLFGSKMKPINQLLYQHLDVLQTFCRSNIELNILQGMDHMSPASQRHGFNEAFLEIFSERLKQASIAA